MWPWNVCRHSAPMGHHHPISCTAKQMWKKERRQLFVLVSTVLCFWGLTLQELRRSATTTFFSSQSIYMHTSSLDSLYRKSWWVGPPKKKHLIPEGGGVQSAQSEASVVINREALVLCRWRAWEEKRKKNLHACHLLCALHEHHKRRSVLGLSHTSVQRSSTEVATARQSVHGLSSPHWADVGTGSVRQWSFVASHKILLVQHLRQQTDDTHAPHVTSILTATDRPTYVALECHQMQVKAGSR